MKLLLTSLILGLLAGLCFADPKAASGDEEEFTLKDLEEQVDKTESGHYQINVLELFYARGDDPVMKIVCGLPVETTGRLGKQTKPTSKRKKSKRLRLSRSMLTSCAKVPAEEFSIYAEFKGGIPKYVEDGWYTIRGKVEFRLEVSGWAAVLVVEKLIPTTEPRGDERSDP